MIYYHILSVSGTAEGDKRDFFLFYGYKGDCFKIMIAEWQCQNIIPCFFQEFPRSIQLDSSPVRMFRMCVSESRREGKREDGDLYTVCFSRFPLYGYFKWKSTQVIYNLGECFSVFGHCWNSLVSKSYRIYESRIMPIHLKWLHIKWSPKNRLPEFRFAFSTLYFFYPPLRYRFIARFLSISIHSTSTLLCSGVSYTEIQ